MVQPLTGSSHPAVAPAGPLQQATLVAAVAVRVKSESGGAQELDLRIQISDGAGDFRLNGRVQPELPPIIPPNSAAWLMEKHSVDAIVGALNVANVRYLVADGLVSWPTATCVSPPTLISSLTWNRPT